MRTAVIFLVLIAAAPVHAGETSFEKITDQCCMRTTGGAVCGGVTWLVGLIELYQETKVTGEKVYYAAYNHREPEQIACQELRPYSPKRWGGGVEF